MALSHSTPHIKSVNDFVKRLDFLVFSDKDDKPGVPSHNSSNVDDSMGRKSTHGDPRAVAVFRMRMGGGGWVRWGTFAWDPEVHMCHFPLDNCKSCPAECNKSKLLLVYKLYQ